MKTMLDKLKAFGLFKIFFLIVLPLTFIYFLLASLYDGNLQEDLHGYLVGFGAVYAAVALAVLFNRNTK